MKYRIALLAGAALLSYGSFATAQTAPPPPSESPAQASSAAAPVTSGTTGDVIVTATRRAERLQNVPVQVVAATGVALAERHLETAKDVQYAVPGLTFTSGATSGSSTFNIRGVGTTAFAPSVEQDVGLNIDGVSIGTEGAGITSLLDVNRVEVLEGPQGTLFGKNASAGLIAIYTNAPVLNTNSTIVHASYGSFNETNDSLVVNLPVTDTAAIRIAGLYERYDGVSTNLADGSKVNGLNEYALRARFRWEPTPQLRIDLTADYDNNDSSCCNSAFRVDQETPLNAVVAADELLGERPGPNNTNVALTPGLPITNANNSGVQAELNYDAGFATLTSLSAYRTYYSMIYIDASFGVPAISQNRQYNVLSQFSQEFRLTSDHPAFGVLDYVAGLYYYENHFRRDQILAPALNSDVKSPVENTSYAAFGQATLHIGDKLRVIGGGRYTDDTVTQTDLTGVPGPNASLASSYVLTDMGSAHADNFSYKVGLQYDFTPDIMAFGTITEGYKGPAFSEIPGSGVVAAHPSEVLPELSTDYEIGLRSQFWDKRVTLNVTAFDQKFTDYQAAVFNSVAFVTYLTNAGSAETKGVELEAVVRPWEGWTFSGNATFLDAIFTNYKGVACATGFKLNFPAICSGPAGTLNATGQPLIGAPKVSYNLIANYTRHIADNYVASAEVTWNYRSAANFLATGDPYTLQPAYGLLGATLSLGSENGRWQVSLYGRNLLDQRFATGIQATPSVDGRAYNQTVSIDEFRTVGVALDLRY